MFAPLLCHTRAAGGIHPSLHEILQHVVVYTRSPASLSTRVLFFLKHRANSLEQAGFETYDGREGSMSASLRKNEAKKGEPWANSREIVHVS